MDALITTAINFVTGLFSAGSAAAKTVRSMLFGNIWMLLLAVFVLMFSLSGGKFKLGDLIEIKI